MSASHAARADTICVVKQPLPISSYKPPTIHYRKIPENVGREAQETRSDPRIFLSWAAAVTGRGEGRPTPSTRYQVICLPSDGDLVHHPSS